MICNNCRDAADNLQKVFSAKYKDTPAERLESRLKEDAIGRAKTLHAKCESNDCFCQHRIK